MKIDLKDLTDAEILSLINTHFVQIKHSIFHLRRLRVERDRRKRL